VTHQAKALAGPVGQAPAHLPVSADKSTALSYRASEALGGGGGGGGGSGRTVRERIGFREHV
jgi:hypothetical protein